MSFHTRIFLLYICHLHTSNIAWHLHSMAIDLFNIKHRASSTFLALLITVRHQSQTSSARPQQPYQCSLAPGLESPRRSHDGEMWKGECLRPWLDEDDSLSIVRGKVPNVYDLRQRITLEVSSQDVLSLADYIQAQRNSIERDKYAATFPLTHGRPILGE